MEKAGRKHYRGTGFNVPEWLYFELLSSPNRQLKIIPPMLDWIHHPKIDFLIYIDVKSRLEIIHIQFQLRPLEPDEDKIGDLFLPHEDDRPFVILSLVLLRSDQTNAPAVSETVVTSQRSATPSHESVRFNFLECQSQEESIPTRQPTPSQPISVADDAGYRVNSDDTSDTDQVDDLMVQLMAKQNASPIQDVIMKTGSYKSVI